MTAKQKIAKLQKLSRALADVTDGPVCDRLWDRLCALLGDVNKEINRLKREGGK